MWPPLPSPDRRRPLVNVTVVPDFDDPPIPHSEPEGPEEQAVADVFRAGPSPVEVHFWTTYRGDEALGLLRRAAESLERHPRPAEGAVSVAALLLALPEPLSAVLLAATVSDPDLDPVSAQLLFGFAADGKPRLVMGAAGGIIRGAWHPKGGLDGD